MNPHVHLTRIGHPVRPGCQLTHVEHLTVDVEGDIGSQIATCIDAGTVATLTRGELIGFGDQGFEFFNLPLFFKNIFVLFVKRIHILV